MFTEKVLLIPAAGLLLQLGAGAANMAGAPAIVRTRRYRVCCHPHRPIETATARALPQVSCTVDGEAFAMPDPEPLLMPVSGRCTAAHRPSPAAAAEPRLHVTALAWSECNATAQTLCCCSLPSTHPCAVGQRGGVAVLEHHRSVC